ncbi:SPOR domain-containing protein [Saccharospirillum mangrovi]|uniref:SPOR domain-containing protein n=1 Tax=Saccharospirillum mangrovi TaxID=2161747 RepID=UPI000D3B7AB2|nr:SPOR domain-containing protein [Saccharospirillum mangrovi]
MQDFTDQTQRMLDYYGLFQDPFGDQADATVFSGAGERLEVAEHLRHLLSFSPQDCLLMAPTGGGKQAIAHQVIRLLDDEWRVAWIDGGDIDRLDSASRELIGQLGLGLKTDGDTASLYRNMADATAQRSNDGENFLLVVQNADLLSPDVQTWLQSMRTLAPRTDIRLRQLWLASSATAIAQSDNDDHWYSLVLEPFTAAEAAAYLNDRFAGSGQANGVPIKDSDIARLNDMAGGMPGELNQVVRDYLIAGTFKTTERKQGFPLTHVLAGAGVVTLIVLTVLYSNQGGEPDVEEPVAELALPEPTDSQAIESEVQQRLAEAVARVEARREEAAAAEAEAADQAETAAATTQPSQPAPSPQPAAQASTQTATPATTPTPSAPAPQPATAAPSQGSGLMANAADNEYTLQLVGVRNRASVESILAELPNQERYDIVTSSYQGRPWYVLIHGRYSGPSAARADIANLPARFRDQEPWARTFASLRNN